MHEPRVTHCHRNDDLQERILMIGKREYLADLGCEVVEEHLIDAAFYTFYQHGKLGWNAMSDCKCPLLATPPWLLRLIAIADHIVLLAIYA